MRDRFGAWLGLAAVVLAHLVISVLHGQAHAGAHVPMSRLGNLFIVIVILAGPIVGLALARYAWRSGAWMVALTMGASLVFGAVNHFALPGPDHVSQVDAVWRGAFAVTAVLLAVTELVGFGLAIRALRERSVPS